MQSAQAANIDITREAVLHSRKEPVWFMENVLNLKKSDKAEAIDWNLDLWQKELAESVADIWRFNHGEKTRFNHKGLNKITVRAMHGPGKTFGIAAIMHWFNFCFPGLIVATAPKEKQLKTRLWPAFRKILNRAESEYRTLIEVTDTKIVWCNDPDWAAQAETASAAENIAGYHGDYLCVVVDEASGVSEELYPAIEGAISTGVFVVLILIGNPTKNVGTFYLSHNAASVSKYYYKLWVSLEKTTRVSREWVRQMEEKYGKDSPIVKIRCYGEFASSDVNQLLAAQWLADSIGRVRETDGSIPKLRVAVDVADGGEDSSVISVALHYQSYKRFIKQHLFNFPPAIATIKTAEAAARIYDSYCQKYPDAAIDSDIVVDALGVGAGTCGWLIDKGYPTIRYIGGEASDNTKLWRNKRTQSYLCYRNDLRDGAVDYDPDYFEPEDEDDFLAQHASIKTKPGTERIEELMTKQEMISKGIKSPDMADSPAMQYATARPSIGHGTNEIEAIGSITDPGGDW